MVEPLQPITLNNKVNLNSVRFAAKGDSQPQVSLETPKDEFVKERKNNKMTKWAIAGIASSLLWDGVSIIKDGGFSKSLEKTSKEFSKMFNKNISLSKAKGIALLLLNIPIGAVIGVGIGQIFEHFRKKD